MVAPSTTGSGRDPPMPSEWLNGSLVRRAVAGKGLVAMSALEPLALSPSAAAAFLGISKRSLSRLIADDKVIARKDGSRTLVDVASLRSYYENLPIKDDHAPLPCSPQMQ